MATSELPKEVPADHKVAVASRVFQKNFVRLSEALTFNDVPDHLYAEDLIEFETFEKSTSSHLTGVEKRRAIAAAVRSVIRVNPDALEKLCFVLNSQPSEHVKKLSKEVKSLYEEKLSEHVASAEEDNENGSKKLTDDFERLHQELEIYQSLLSKERQEGAVIQLIKESTQEAIRSAFSKNESIEVIKGQIGILCNEHLAIPTNMRQWAMAEPENLKSLSMPSSAVPQQEVSDEPPIPSLFSHDVLYHAGLCSEVVSTCTAANFQDFLNAYSSGHSLTEASMSISQDRDNVDRYMIARQDDKIYIAFQSEASIQTWTSEYKSFSEGFEKQLERIPMRFIEEQLRDQKKIVLTGFSYGGMLSCCVAANLWKTSHISEATLKQSVICITFGQPLIHIKFFQDIAKDCPELENTIHTIFLKEDMIPQILRYFGVGCLNYQRSLTNELKPLPPTASELDNEDFHGDFSYLFLKALALLEKTKVAVHHGSETQKSQALNDVKRALKAVLSYAENDNDVTLLCGKCYIISLSKHEGLVWNPATKHLAIEKLGHLFVAEVDMLDENLFSKHRMNDYQQKIFRSYLDKGSEKYLTPGQEKTVNPIREVAILKPNVDQVDFHKYSGEHAVILQGRNLWFCHEVRLGEKANILHIKTPAQKVTGRDIKFNFKTSGKTANLLVHKKDQVKVSVLSHFANPIRQTVPVGQEPYSFSLRQIQLAKQTPTQIIELAFWSAMLEQLPKNTDKSTPSKRFSQVTHFLEEAVKVVPLESILDAIAYSSSDDVATECANALKASKIKIPHSAVMMKSLQNAAIRMRTGLYGHEMDALIASAFPNCLVQYQFPLPAPQNNRIDVSVVAYQRHSPTFAQAVLGNREILIPFPKNISVPIPAWTSKTNPDVANYLEKQCKSLEKVPLAFNEHVVLGNLSIEHVYPVSSQRRHTKNVTTLQSPIEVLKNGRKQLSSFIEDAAVVELDSLSFENIESSNEQMLHLVREIRERNLKICAELLGAFMEVQISIPLLTESQCPLDTADILSSRSDPVAMGVWAMFSMGKHELQAFLRSTSSHSLYLDIADYVTGVLGENLKNPRKSRYDGKLQFLLQGIKKTVSCNSQYVGYSLEHQLCNNLKFEKSISVKKLINDWDRIFKDDALSLVAKSHRSLIARWLKWAVLIHDLREALADYTCVGVIGLTNSGKSTLVKKLFDLQILVGTTEKKRTTVPLMYNLDGKVDGLDVIDFPGVDDEDNSVPELAKLLLGLVQVVIFVVDYRRLTSATTKEWFHQLKAERDIPVLVCLTHADQLYVEFLEEDPKTAASKTRDDLYQKQEKADHHSWTMKPCCFHITDSRLTTESLQKAGIGFPEDVGEWLVDTFSSKLDQSGLADRLARYVARK